MKAVVFRHYGPPSVLHLAELPTPIPGDGEILIKVRAVNAFPGDCEMRAFKMHPSLWLPIRLYMGITGPRNPVLGQELAGTVVATGAGVTRFREGDEIFGLTQMRLGAYAEYTCLPEDYPLTLRPADISPIEAATLSVGGSNALHFIERARLGAGQSILINGACGSIGTFAIQLAKNAGAIVTAVDSEDKLAALTELGADRVIDYRSCDFTRQGEQYDVIFDVVGTSAFSRSLDCLLPGGRYLHANVGLSVMLRGLLTTRMRNVEVITALAAPGIKQIERLRELVVAGQLRPLVDQVFPLEAAVAAHEFIESGKRRGHVVLSVSDNG